MAIGDSTRINTNIAAFNALNALKSVNRSLEISQLRLATGRRINEVGDDPAGFTISRRLEARSRGLSVALDNVGTAKNVLSIAEGGLLNIGDILITIKEKVTQAASDSLGVDERTAIQTEIVELIAEIDSIANETTFNDNFLIQGTFVATIQSGEQPGNIFAADLTSINISSAQLSIEASDVSLEILSAASAQGALTKVDAALDTVNTALQKVGAFTTRLSSKESSLSIAITNTEATKSRILDADIAQEQLNATRFLILQQTSTAQLAQSNITPHNVLALFT